MIIQQKRFSLDYLYNQKCYKLIPINLSRQPNKNIPLPLFLHTITVSLKYLRNLRRSFKMPLINCKVELKLEWTNYCVLSVAGAANINAICNNITFTIKDTKLYLRRNIVTKNNPNLSKFLSE